MRGRFMFPRGGVPPLVNYGEEDVVLFAASHTDGHIPRPLEFLSYCVNFQTILVGPPLSYKDYLIYIEDRQADYLKTDAQKTYFLNFLPPPVLFGRVICMAHFGRCRMRIACNREWLVGVVEDCSMFMRYFMVGRAVVSYA
ncbi:unnamed protein product [Dibothriocephalus latus]|uniref:Uncharacterized protein n=1 Tax=Dibothriocephalus latus TaxID=60516 RepID=A0A3P7MLS7_DIBLA|nr:unnamed protein product [Dibothriocephalus latus]